MSQKINYYKLGLFIIIGTFLFIVVIIVLGTGSVFRKKIIMETAINQSVNGLSVGSAVKFRGVQIGSVQKISFHMRDKNGKFNPEHADYNIYVLFEVHKKYLQGMSDLDIQNFVQDSVKKGLRIKPATQGLSGSLYLELNFVNPNTNPPIKLRFQPEYIYIPSIPSTMNRIESAVNTITEVFQSVNKKDINNTIDGLRQSLDSITNFLKNAKLGKIENNLSESLNQTKFLLKRLNQLLKTPYANSIIPDASKFIKGLKNIINSSEDNIISTLTGLEKSSINLTKISDKILKLINNPDIKNSGKDLSQALKNIEQASNKVNNAATQLHSVLQRINELMSSSQNNIGQILDDAKDVTDNLKELTDEAKRNPSSILFGSPPKKIEVK